MKKFIISLMLSMLLLNTTSCLRLPTPTGIHDFYGEYFFELPFEHTITYVGSELFFTTDYSIEQMVQLLNETEYNATLHNVGDEQNILITAYNNGSSYYFVIFDNKRSYDEIFMLSGAVSGIQLSTGGAFSFLAPTHLMRESSVDNRYTIYASFEDIVNFYRTANRGNIAIDEDHMRVYIGSETHVRYIEGETPIPGGSIVAGTVILQFVETEEDSHIVISATIG